MDSGRRRGGTDAVQPTRAPISIGRNRRLVRILVSTASLLGPALTLDIVYEIQKGLSVVQTLKRPYLFPLVEEDPPAVRAKVGPHRSSLVASASHVWGCRTCVSPSAFMVSGKDDCSRASDTLLRGRFVTTRTEALQWPRFPRTATASNITI